MTVTTPELAEAVAEREDRRRERIAAWLRRRHRRWPSHERWDHLYAKPVVMQETNR